MAEDLGGEGLREVLVDVLAALELLELARDALRRQRRVLGGVVVAHVVHEEVGVREEARAQRLQARVGRGQEAACG